MNFGKASLLAAALLTGLATPLFAQSTPAGTWEVVLETPQGANTVTLTVTVAGDKADGTLASAIGTMPITGTATADTIQMSGNLEIQGMSLLLGINGKVVGDAISGTVKMGDFGEAPFSGKRAAAAGAAAAAPAAPAVAPTGVAGKWNVTLTLTGVGDFPLTANLTQTGEAVTGTFVSMLGEVPVKGTFAGSALNLEFTTETPQGPMSVTMTGELKDQALTGKAAIAGLGEADWKAVR